MNPTIVSVLVLGCLAIVSASGFASISSAPGSRLIGGSLAKLGDAPTQVSIQFRYKHLCGGVIVGDHHVLTAATCLLSTHYRLLDKMHLRVLIGSVSTDELDPDNADELGMYLHVSSIFIHEGLNTLSMINNLAIIKVNETITESTIPAVPGQREIKYISIARQQTTSIPNGVHCTLSGWGQSYQSGSFQPELRIAKAFISNHRDCKKQYSNITDAEICATLIDGTTYERDLGAGLYCDDELTGILSVDGLVYEEILPYKDWIKETKDRTDYGDFYNDAYSGAIANTGSVLLLSVVSFIFLICNVH